MTAPVSSIETAESPDQVRSDSIEIANVYGSGGVCASVTTAAAVNSPRSRANVTPVSSVARGARISDDTLGGNVDFFA